MPLQLPRTQGRRARTAGCLDALLQIEPRLVSEWLG
eukprot:CAMPEP_0168361032 /NCGR_PEP_ID=MMETSP0228-20121227/2460_1 /TAXON_ID=133427 /ORGANISM="Protoceratium reticulatum, Strain CCCM 535 (=CCMP 1889)" /LENGTH=35 /DNA_ID= /DNA_START= /DNA_END= /DNA_ORIENTATION=